MKIVLDTNFLYIPIRERIDIFRQFKEEFEGKKEFLVLKDSFMEIEKLKKKGIHDSDIAVENILKQEIKIVDINGPKDVDEKILDYAIKQNAFIASLDKKLRDKAKSKGLKTITYNKSKKKIMVV